jgi:class 3 adenylate cyclase
VADQRPTDERKLATVLFADLVGSTEPLCRITPAVNCSGLVCLDGRAVGAELERLSSRVLELGAHVGGDEVAALDLLEAVLA